MKLLRMSHWLALGLAFYGLAVLVSQPQLQTALFKAAHLTAGAYLGFWIDRHALGTMIPTDSDGRKLSRAILVAAAILGMSLGL